MKLANLLDIPVVYSLWQAPFYKQKVYHLVNYLKTANRSLRVLDLGCGPGTNIGFFAWHHYTGVDLSLEYIQSIEKASDRVLICSDVNTFLDQDESTYDLILINSLMHHLDTTQVNDLLSKLPARLNPNAVVFIFDLVLPSRFSIPTILARLDRGNFPRKYHEWADIFTSFLSRLEQERYYLKLGPIKLWEMIYFKGVAK